MSNAPMPTPSSFQPPRRHATGASSNLVQHVAQPPSTSPITASASSWTLSSFTCAAIAKSRPSRTLIEADCPEASLGHCEQASDPSASSSSLPAVRAATTSMSADMRPRTTKVFGPRELEAVARTRGLAVVLIRIRPVLGAFVDRDGVDVSALDQRAIFGRPFARDRSSPPAFNAVDGHDRAGQKRRRGQVAADFLEHDARLRHGPCPSPPSRFRNQ